MDSGSIDCKNRAFYSCKTLGEKKTQTNPEDSLLLVTENMVIFMNASAAVFNA